MSLFLLSSNSGSITIGEKNMDVWKGRVDDIFKGPHTKLASIQFETKNDIDQLVNKLEILKYNLPD